MCILQQLTIPSRLTVVLVSLVLLAVKFWLTVVIPPRRWAPQCPEECRRFDWGSNVDCSGSGLNSIPPILPQNVERLNLENNNITFFENVSFFSR
jgi:hypothetical protein